MTNGVKELDMTKEFKSVKEQFKAMYNALKKWPFMMGITILMFVLLISSEYLADNELILFLQIIGFAISFAFIVMILILDKHGKQYLKKMSFSASLWFASCLALADFNQPTLKLIIQLYTAFLFIFDACIIPDFLSSIDPKSQKREKDFDDTSMAWRAASIFGFMPESSLGSSSFSWLVVISEARESLFGQSR